MIDDNTLALVAQRISQSVCNVHDYSAIAKKGKCSVEDAAVRNFGYVFRLLQEQQDARIREETEKVEAEARRKEYDARMAVANLHFRWIPETRIRNALRRAYADGEIDKVSAFTPSDLKDVSYLGPTARRKIMEWQAALATKLEEGG